MATAARGEEREEEEVGDLGRRSNPCRHGRSPAAPAAPASPPASLAALTPAASGNGEARRTPPSLPYSLFPFFFSFPLYLTENDTDILLLQA